MTPKRLDVELVARGLVATRTKAQRLISASAVVVDGVLVSKPAAVVSSSAEIVLREEDLDVGRGAQKIRAAFERWPVPLGGATCVDLGASTGGFTQVLLEGGASEVVAIDVGHGQLDKRVATDGRVHVIERTNVMSLSADWWAKRGLPQGVSVVVADLSFISLTKVIPVIVQTFGVHSHYIVLVKPQFEVGRGRISHGVVKDAQLRTKALVHVAAAFAASQVPVRDVIVSPIHGEKGNEEYLLYASATSSVHPAEWDQSLGE